MDAFALFGGETSWCDGLRLLDQGLARREQLPYPRRLVVRAGDDACPVRRHRHAADKGQVAFELGQGQDEAVAQRMADEGVVFGRMLGEAAAREAFGAFMAKRLPDFSKL